MSQRIYHQAKIVDKQTDRLIVSVERGSACASCYNRGACSAFDNKEVIYTVQVDQIDDFQIGETIRLSIETKMGLKAVLIAYVYPLLVLLGSFTLARLLHLSELLQIIIALAAMGGYYFIISRFRSLFDKKFTFTVEKLPSFDF